LINENIILQSDEFGESEYYIREFLTNKNKNSFIKEVERMCRTSDIYKRWLNFVKGTLVDKFVCYKSGLNSEVCRIEIHHHPVTLYDYTSLAVNLLLTQGGISVFNVAEQVMKWHFENNVGFIPLSETEHQMYHNKASFIPMDIVEGNWKDFITEIYPNELIDQYVLSKIEMLETVTLDTCNVHWFINERSYFPIG
jgi:hypothetical protein